MISINCADDEIQFIGSPKGMMAFGKLLFGVDNFLQVNLKINPNRYYPIVIKTLNINVTDNPDHKIQLEIVNDTLKLNSGIDCIKILGESLLNFFDGDVEYQDHFHIYYDAEDPCLLLDNNQFNLIFSNDDKG